MTKLTAIVFGILFCTDFNDGDNKMWAQCNNANDYTALRTLYLQTNGDNWNDNTGWPTEADFTVNIAPSVDTNMADWYGITCGTTFRVIDVNLSNNGLTGTIPSEIGILTELENLSLRLNQLTGNIPPSLGNLEKLIGLFLYDNMLTGSIPSSLGNLDNVMFFRLANNQLTGDIPVELGNLPAIRTLYLNNNQLTGSIPSSLTQLASVQDINVDGNQLTGSIPSGFGDLANLEYFFANDNNLSGCIPADLIHLCPETIDLSGNPLLAWQGDFGMFCATSGHHADQYGSACDDGILDNGTDVINADCSCGAVCISMENTRQGPLTGSWNDSPSNWSAGRIPALCDDVLIPEPFEVTVLSGNAALARTLEVKSGASLDSEQNATLKILNN